MKWSEELPEVKGMITVTVGYKCPELGDTKEEVKFAWFPVGISKLDGETYSVGDKQFQTVVWLEKYTQVSEYKKVTEFRKSSDIHGLSNFDDGTRIFETKKWVVTKTKVI